MDDTVKIKPYQTLAYVIVALTVSLLVIKQLFLSDFDDEWLLFVGYSLAMLIWAGALLKQEIVFTQTEIVFTNIPVKGEHRLGKQTQIAYTDIILCRTTPSGIEIVTDTERLNVSLSVNSRLLSRLRESFEAHSLHLSH